MAQADAGRGRLVTVEGGEGVGKSLFTGSLAEALRRWPLDVELTREPGGTPVADHLRALFAAPPAGESLTTVTEALLVSAARSQHVARRIEPALAAGRWVLCDRFYDSTLVYQGELGGLPRSTLDPLIALSTGGLAPDVTFLLDCDVDVSMARLKMRRPGDSTPVSRYDEAKRSDHERLRQAFLTLARTTPRFAVLDASQSPDTVLTAALQILRERFGQL